MVHNYFKHALPIAALAAMMTFSAQLNAQENQDKLTPKFHFDVTGYRSLTNGNNGPNDFVQNADGSYSITEDAKTRKDDKGVPNANPVSIDVFDDFHFNITLPQAEYSNLSTEACQVNVGMNGVQSLGLKADEKRSFQKDACFHSSSSLNMAAPLSQYLSNVYAFKGISCPITIQDGEDDKNRAGFTYVLSGVVNYDANNLNNGFPDPKEIQSDAPFTLAAIVGKPDNSENARAAWHKLAAHVRASQGDDIVGAQAVFAKGAYASFGYERIHVYNTVTADLEKGVTDVNNFVYTNNADSTFDQGLTIYLPAGSTLGLSSSNAVLTQDVTIHADLSGIGDTADVEKILDQQVGTPMGSMGRLQIFYTLMSYGVKQAGVWGMYGLVLGVNGMADIASKANGLITFTVTFKANKPATIGGNGNADNKTQLENKNYANVTFARDIKANGKWATLCVPFGIPADQLKAAFGDDVQVWTFDKATDTGSNISLKFKQVESIEPGVAYLIKVSKDFSEYTFTDVPVLSDEVASNINVEGVKDSYQFKGTAGFMDEDIFAKYNGRACFFAGNDGLQLRRPVKSCIAKATRCYFLYPEDTTGAKPFLFNVGDETTGIENVIDTNDNAPASIKVYNLNGQYVGDSVKDLNRGIYIQNGKKFVVK